MKAAIILLALLCAGCSRDDSDASNGDRSNMTPRTDHLSGCQYLTYGFSGITPRMGADGKQICREVAK